MGGMGNQFFQIAFAKFLRITDTKLLNIDFLILSQKEATQQFGILFWIHSFSFFHTFKSKDLHLNF